MWSVIDGNKQNAMLARVSNVTTTLHHKSRLTQKQVAVTFGRKRNQHNAIRRSLQTAEAGMPSDNKASKMSFVAKAVEGAGKKAV